MSVPPRDISPILRWVRNLLLGRQLKNALRFQDKVSTRSPPPPNLPDGPSHKAAFNYYYTRDGRRENRAPMILAEGGERKALTSGEAPASSSEKKSPGTKLKFIYPGTTYEWKEVPK